MLDNIFYWQSFASEHGHPQINKVQNEFGIVLKYARLLLRFIVTILCNSKHLFENIQQLCLLLIEIRFYIPHLALF